MAASEVEFFVSYTSADRPWAEWIAWVLEDAGYSTLLQAWDMQPGANFVLEMDDAARYAKRTVAVLSPAFFESPFCRAEWAAAFAECPDGADRALVPIRVRDCEPTGLLGQIVYIDVVGMSQSESRAALLAGVRAGRAKPQDAPVFPEAETPSGTGGPPRRPEGGAAVFNVPVMTRTFVGRTRPLELIRERLAGKGAVAVTQAQAIHGMGGVGKTQIAARYARMHRDEYDVIWWLRAEEPQTLRSDLAALASPLGLRTTGLTDDQAAIDTVRRWLESNSRWLLVFDNAARPDAIVELLPEGSGGHVLITSRGHADWRAVGAEPLQLDVWERGDSHKFLMRRTGERDTTALDRVAAVLGDLPLALEQAAAYTNAKAITLSGYTERLRTRAPELFAAGRPVGYEHTVSTVWTLAFEELARHPVGRSLLEISAHLAPERIPRELLEAAMARDNSLETSGQEVDDGIELLLAYALLTVSAEQTFGMHRLIGALGRTRANAASRAHAAATAVDALAALWPAKSREHKEWPTCERLVAHAIAATEHLERYGAALEQTARLLTRVAEYQQARAEYTSAYELTRRALGIFDVIYASEHPEVAHALTNLGNLQRQLGEFEAARRTQERALVMFEAIYGPEHLDVAIALTNLGGVEWELGKFEAAQTIQQRALAVFEALDARENPEIARTLTNLGLAQYQLGDFESARATQERALAIKQTLYGPAHPEVAITLGNLGIAQQQLGEFEAARATQQRALSIKEAIYGPDHPSVAHTLVNLGNTLRDLGAPEAGLRLQQRALEIEEAAFGSEHPEVAATRAELAMTQRQIV